MLRLNAEFQSIKVCLKQVQTSAFSRILFTRVPIIPNGDPVSAIFSKTWMNLPALFWKVAPVPIVESPHLFQKQLVFGLSHLDEFWHGSASSFMSNWGTCLPNLPGPTDT